jgi:NAD(P)-dependent dehydrogenase (short-subunit alcohol dehydrogenase family)
MGLTIGESQRQQGRLVVIAGEGGGIGEKIVDRFLATVEVVG